MDVTQKKRIKIETLHNDKVSFVCLKHIFCVSRVTAVPSGADQNIPSPPASWRRVLPRLRWLML